MTVDGVFIANVIIIIFSLIGNVLTIYKRRSSFTIGSLGVIPSLYLALHFHNYGSVFSCATGIAFCIWGWIEWRDE